MKLGEVDEEERRWIYFVTNFNFCCSNKEM